MTKNKALESSAFAASVGGSSAAAAQPAKASPLKKPFRSRKATPKSEAPTSEEVALSPVAPLESGTRTAKPKATRAKSTAVTHRHKKLEIAPVAELETMRVENSPLVISINVPAQPLEPSNEEIAKMAYSYYVARGYQPGNESDDWFRAVAELRAKLKR